MDYKEFSSKIKSKYPQYNDIDDRVLAQKMVAKYPEYKDVTFDESKTDWKVGITRGIKESFTRPAAFAKDLGTNPESMARAIPPLAGMAFGISPIPGGATLGTGLGQGVRDIALKALNKPVPSGLQHGLELGGAVLGDVMAIPAMKKSYFGGQIAKAEKMSGVPEPQNITSLPRPAGPNPVSGAIDDAIKLINDPQTPKSPTFWKQIKDQTDWFYQRGKDTALSGMDRVKLRWLSKSAQDGLNASVPGRSVPSQALSKSQTIPNLIGKGYKMIPSQFRRGAAYGTGVGAAGYSAYEIMKKLLGG